jgi:hypothetical protein
MEKYYRIKTDRGYYISPKKNMLVVYDPRFSAVFTKEGTIKYVEEYGELHIGGLRIEEVKE